MTTKFYDGPHDWVFENFSTRWEVRGDRVFWWVTVNSHNGPWSASTEAVRGKMTLSGYNATEAAGLARDFDAFD